MLPFGAGIDVNLHGVKFQRATLPGLRRSFGGFLRRADKRSEEHTSELQSQSNLVCRLLLEKKKDVSHHIAVHVSAPAHKVGHPQGSLNPGERVSQRILRVVHSVYKIRATHERESQIYDTAL